MTKQTMDWTLETIREQFRNTRIYDESALKEMRDLDLIADHLDWPDEKQAYFVRSVKLGVPLSPLVFLGEPGKLKIIDGHERVRSILNFYEEGNAEFENIPMRVVIFDEVSEEFLGHLAGLLNYQRPVIF